MGARSRRPAVALALAAGLALLMAVPAQASHDGSLASGCPPGSVPAAGFADVHPDDVHRAAIDCVVWWGAARGTSPTRFAPTARVTRGQTASFVVRLLDVAGSPLPPAGPTRFADVPAGGAHSGSINRLSAAGIVGGLADERFVPAMPVSRAQMASFLIRAYEYQAGVALPDAADHFLDVNGSVHEANINKAARAGIANGRRAGVYDPAAAVSRGEMASFLARLLDTLVEGGTVLPARHEAHPEGVPGAKGEDPSGAQPVPIGTSSQVLLSRAGLPAPGYGLPTRDDSEVGFHPGAAVQFERENRTTALPLDDGRRAEAPAPADGAPVGGPAPSGAMRAQLSSLGQPVFPYRAAAYLPQSDLPSTVGQLESWRGGRRSGTCTATVVARDVVITAAHCAQRWGSSSANDAYRFSPARFGDHVPHGSWDTTETDAAWIPTGWSSGWVTATTERRWRFAFDYALIRFPPNAHGQHLGDVVGIQPILLGAARLDLPKFAIGYPTEGWFHAGAGRPWYCASDDPGPVARHHHANDFHSMGWGCEWSGGGSGGPVFALHDGRWWLVSLNSTGSHPVTCVIACISERNLWYVRNAWGPDLHIRHDVHDFGAFWDYVAAQG